VNKPDWRNFAAHYAQQMNYYMHTGKYMPRCCLFIMIIIFTGEEFADLCNAAANGDWGIIFD